MTFKLAGTMKCDSPADAHLAAVIGNVLSADGFMVSGPHVVDLVKRIRREGWRPAHEACRLPPEKP